MVRNGEIADVRGSISQAQHPNETVVSIRLYTYIYDAEMYIASKGPLQLEARTDGFRELLQKLGVEGGGQQLKHGRGPHQRRHRYRHRLCGAAYLRRKNRCQM